MVWLPDGKKFPLLCQHGLAHRQKSPFPGKNGIDHRAGKSII